MSDETVNPEESQEIIPFLSRTEIVLANVVETGDFDLGFDFINNLHEMGNNFARAISVMLTGMEDAWKLHEHEGETFFQVAVRRTGLKPETIQRHTKNQRLLESDVIPEEFRPQIEGGKQNSLERIANVVNEGYELTHDNWLAISEKVGDEREVGKIVRDIKGVPPRSNWLMIWIDERGVLWAQTKEELVECGRLDTFSDSPAVKKAIARLTNCAGVKPRVEF